MTRNERLINILEQKKVEFSGALTLLADPSNEEVLALAEKLFDGDLNKAVNWLLSPIKALSGDAPVDRLISDEGREQIKTIIERIEHGIFS